jgi:hypothetical protein
MGIRIMRRKRECRISDRRKKGRRRKYRRERGEDRGAGGKEVGGTRG